MEKETLNMKSVYNKIKNKYPFVYEICGKFYYFGMDTFYECTEEEKNNYIKFKEGYSEVEEGCFSSMANRKKELVRIFNEITNFTDDKKHNEVDFSELISLNSTEEQQNILVFLDKQIKDFAEYHKKIAEWEQLLP